jgi:hypothetical protein
VQTTTPVANYCCTVSNNKYRGESSFETHSCFSNRDASVNTHLRHSCCTALTLLGGTKERGASEIFWNYPGILTKRGGKPLEFQEIFWKYSDRRDISKDFRRRSTETIEELSRKSSGNLTLVLFYIE